MERVNGPGGVRPDLRTSPFNVSFVAPARAIPTGPTVRAKQLTRRYANGDVRIDGGPARASLLRRKASLMSRI